MVFWRWGKKALLSHRQHILTKHCSYPTLSPQVPFVFISFFTSKSQKAIAKANWPQPTQNRSGNINWYSPSNYLVCSLVHVCQFVWEDLFTLKLTSTRTIPCTSLHRTGYRVLRPRKGEEFMQSQAGDPSNRW